MLAELCNRAVKLFRAHPPNRDFARMSDFKVKTAEPDKVRLSWVLLRAKLVPRGGLRM